MKVIENEYDSIDTIFKYVKQGLIRVELSNVKYLSEWYVKWLFLNRLVYYLVKNNNEIYFLLFLDLIQRACTVQLTLSD